MSLRRRQQHGDVALGTGAEADEVPGQPVRAGVEFGVRQRGVAEHDRGSPRRTRDLGLDQVGEGRRRNLVAGRVPLGEKQPPLVGVHDVELPDPALRFGGDGGEETGEAPRDPFGRVPVEQVGGELQEPVHSRASGRSVRKNDRSNLAAGEATGRTRAVRPGRSTARSSAACWSALLKFRPVWNRGCRDGGTHRVDRLHEPLERHVLVGVGGEVGGPYPAQQLREAGVAGQVGAQHQVVDEEADERRPAPRPCGSRPGSRSTMSVARTEPVQQAGQGGVHDHEDGRVVLPGEPDQGRVDLRPHGDGNRLATVGRHGGAGPVERQLQLLGQVRSVVRQCCELPGQRAVRVVGRRPARAAATPRSRRTGPASAGQPGSSPRARAA